MRIHFCWEGKTKDANLRALIAEYSKRLQGFVDFRVEEMKDSKGRSRTSRLTSDQQRLLRRHKSAFKIFLEPGGRQMSSQEFSHWLGEHALRGTKELLFVLGGPEGFSPAFLEKANMRLSLTRMTLTHEWARALLAEQVYRGFAILRGHPYSR